MLSVLYELCEKNASHARNSKLTYKSQSEAERGKKNEKQFCHLHICLFKQRNEPILSTTTTPCDEWNERETEKGKKTRKSGIKRTSFADRKVWGKSFELSRPKNPKLMPTFRALIQQRENTHTHIMQWCRRGQVIEPHLKEFAVLIISSGTNLKVIQSSRQNNN